MSTPTSEVEALERLREDEVDLDRLLEAARREAAQVVDDARAEAARLREQARVALEQELHSLREQAGPNLERDLVVMHKETTRRLAELRQRAAQNKERALALVLACVAGRPKS